MLIRWYIKGFKNYFITDDGRMGKLPECIDAKDWVINIPKGFPFEEEVIVDGSEGYFIEFNEQKEFYSLDELRKKCFKVEYPFLFLPFVFLSL